MNSRSPALVSWTHLARLDAPDDDLLESAVGPYVAHRVTAPTRRRAAMQGQRCGEEEGESAGVAFAVFEADVPLDVLKSAHRQIVHCALRVEVARRVAEDVDVLEQLDAWHGRGVLAEELDKLGVPVQVCGSISSTPFKCAEDCPESSCFSFQVNKRLSPSMNAVGRHASLRVNHDVPFDVVQQVALGRHPPDRWTTCPFNLASCAELLENGVERPPWIEEEEEDSHDTTSDWTPPDASAPFTPADVASALKLACRSAVTQEEDAGSRGVVWGREYVFELLLLEQLVDAAMFEPDGEAPPVWMAQLVKQILVKNGVYWRAEAPLRAFTTRPTGLILSVALDEEPQHHKHERLPVSETRDLLHQALQEKLPLPALEGTAHAASGVVRLDGLPSEVARRLVSAFDDNEEIEHKLVYLATRVLRGKEGGGRAIVQLVPATVPDGVGFLHEPRDDFGDRLHVAGFRLARKVDLEEGCNVAEGVHRALDLLIRLHLGGSPRGTVPHVLFEHVSEDHSLNIPSVFRDSDYARPAPQDEALSTTRAQRFSDACSVPLQQYLSFSRAKLVRATDHGVCFLLICSSRRAFSLVQSHVVPHLTKLSPDSTPCKSFACRVEGLDPERPGLARCQLLESDP